jgi:hypothetical protein
MTWQRSGLAQVLRLSSEARVSKNNGLNFVWKRSD